MADDSIAIVGGVELPKTQEAEKDSPAPDARQALEQLKVQLEREKLTDEERELRLQQMMDKVYGEKASAVLRRIETLDEPTEEAKNLLRTGTSVLITEAHFKGKEIHSAQELIDLYRADSHASNQVFAETLVRVLANDTSELSRWYKREGWDAAMEEAVDFEEAVRAAQDTIQEKEAAEKKEEESGEKGTYDKTKDFYKDHESDLKTAAMLGVAGLGAFWLVHKLFEKKDAGKTEEEKSGFGSKVALTALIGGFVGGQVLGMENVQDWIARGDHESWVYKPWARGWTELVDLEFGNAADYWTGNGPTESERSQFDTLAGIFKVSESVLWADSKLSYGDFMEGKSGTINPFHKADEDKIRTQIKDYYQGDLERRIPELKDPETAKKVSMKEVFMKGLASGAIRDKDTTKLDEGDRKDIDDQFDEDQAKIEGTRRLLDKPEENMDKLDAKGDELLTDISELDGSVEDYWGEYRVAFEDAMGVNFSFGHDDPDNYRDLKAAREKFVKFFDDHAKSDHAFFEEKEGRVKAFKVFLAKHKDEKPWTDSTKEEFEDYKKEILDIQEKILRSKELAKQENLTKMKEDLLHRTSDDASEGLTLAVMTLSGAWDYLGFRFEKVMEGSVPWVALTIAQGAGIASEFIGQPAPKSGWGVGYRIVKGATWNITGKPGWYTLKLSRDALHAFRAFEYDAEGLTVEMLKGKLTTQQVGTRIGWAEKLSSWYELKNLPAPTSGIQDFKSGQVQKMKELLEVRERIGDIRVMNEYVDGKIDIRSVPDPVRALLQRIPSEKISEIRAYRLLARTQTVSGTLFDEVLMKLKDPKTTISADAEAAYRKLGLSEGEATFMKDYMSKEEGNGVLREFQKIKKPTPEGFEWIKGEGTGDAASHTYRFGKAEVVLTHKEIAERAAQLATQERAAGRVPPEGETAAWHDSNWGKAAQQLCEEKFTAPVKVREGAYKVAGQEFAVSDAEIAAKMAAESGLTEEQAIRRLAIEKATASLKVEGVKTAGGKYKYKVNGEWLEFEKPMKASEVKAKFQENLGSKLGDFEKFAAQAKTLKYFAAFEKVLGTATAVWVIWHLETATDKRKATAEIASCVASFYAGMKLTDWTVGKNRSPVQRLIIDLLGGLAAAYFGAESIEKIVMSYYKDIPASYAVSGEVASLMEKHATRTLVLGTLRSAESGLLRTGMEKMGMKGLTELFAKRVSSTFLKRIAVIAAKQGFRDILAFLGVRGVAVGLLLADDATVIGVADDIIAAGLLIWMGKDIIDILLLVGNAKELQDQMAERQKHEIASYEIRPAAARAEFQEKLIPYGCSIEDAPEKLGEETFFDILRGIADLKLVIEREETLGHEEWTLHNGEAVGMAVFNQDGSVLCEMSDEDAKVMDEKLSEQAQEPEPTR